MQRDVLHVTRHRVDDVGKGRNDLPGIVANHLLHGAIEFLAPCFVEGGSRLQKQLIEVIPVPERIVPGRVRLECDRQLQVSGRTHGPMSPMEGLYHPHSVPEPVSRNPDDLDVDPGLRCHLAIDLRAFESADSDGRNQQLERVI